MRTRHILIAAITALSLLLVPQTANAASSKKETIRVYHQAVNPTHVSGQGVGTVRTFFIPMAVNGTAANNQYLVGTLTTFAENVQDGLEVRGSNLTFVFGEEANQLVVGGISLYPPAGSTLAAGTRTVRPVLGGSGIYEGATGQVVSQNLGATGWTHTFRITIAQ